MYSVEQYSLHKHFGFIVGASVFDLGFDTPHLAYKLAFICCVQTGCQSYGHGAAVPRRGCHLHDLDQGCPACDTRLPNWCSNGNCSRRNPPLCPAEMHDLVLGFSLFYQILSLNLILFMLLLANGSTCSIASAFSPIRLSDHLGIQISRSGASIFKSFILCQ